MLSKGTSHDDYLDRRSQTSRLKPSILLIRGKRVILDHDLATLYGVATRPLNQAVKRNLDRFPEDFMFQLTKAETEEWQRLKPLRSQNVID